TGVVLAAKSPQRVRSLVIVNGTARMLWAPDYPAGVDIGLANPFMTVGLEPDAVEKGFDALEIVAPTVSRDDAFRTWWDLAGNRAASPTMAGAVTKVVADSDVRDTLADVAVPTLIVHRDQARFSAVEHGRYLAHHIAGSRYVELPGPDSLYWTDDAASVLDEVEEFITGLRGFEAERVLTT